MDAYEILEKVGEGSFGVVLKARRRRDGLLVAIKRVHFRRGQDPQHSALREFTALRTASHPAVVGLLDVFPHGAGITMVLEYMASDLSQVLQAQRGPMTEHRARGFARQLLEGLAHMEGLGMLHRDIKPANLLIAEGGTVLKIGDFGLARVRHPEGGSITQQVTTRWYRAPEILFGARRYSHAIDVWAAGCVLAELLNNGPLWCGESDIDQLFRVLHALGSPSEESWPGVRNLPDYGKISFPEMPGVPLRELVPDASPEALDLLSRMLVLCPEKRITAAAALGHPFFWAEPERYPEQDSWEYARATASAKVDLTDVTAELSFSVPR